MEQTGQQTVDSPRNRDLGDLLRALFDEAWRARRRRRAMYGGIVLALVVVGGMLFATLRPASAGSGSPAVAAGPSFPVSGVAVSQHVYIGLFRLTGKRGNLAVSVKFADAGARFWNIHGGGQFSGLDLRSGQYEPLAGGHGKRVQAGGHASEWYARLFGFVVPKDRGPRQRVVINLKGRPQGTFTLVPLEPGLLKRDSGTQRGGWMG